MNGALDLGSMVEAARKAAAAGDFSTAARLLRDVSVIQEATLGSLHPELAKTLNVLALVCERANYVAEAEQCYRRAHAIAVASLGPRDRKSTRLNSSHVAISYAVFCLKKKKTKKKNNTQKQKKTKNNKQQ